MALSSTWILGSPTRAHGQHRVAGVHQLPQPLLSPSQRGGLGDWEGTSPTGPCGCRTQGGRQHPTPSLTPQAGAQRCPESRNQQPRGHPDQLSCPGVTCCPQEQGAALRWHHDSAQIRCTWQGLGVQVAVTPSMASQVAPGSVPTGHPSIPARLRTLPLASWGLWGAKGHLAGGQGSPLFLWVPTVRLPGKASDFPE